MLWFKRKGTVTLTTSDKVNIAKGKVQSALSMFAVAHQKIEEANNVLEEARKEDEAKIAELQVNLERANDEIAMNLALQMKLEEFLPKKV